MLRTLVNLAIAKEPCTCQFRLANHFSKKKDVLSKIELKIIKLTSKISEHDLDIKVGQISNWLKSQHDVKVSIAADGSPGSKIQTDEILKTIQSKIPDAETKQLIKKASGIHFTLMMKRSNIASSDVSQEDRFTKPSAMSMNERSEKIKGELSKELADMMKDMDKKKK